MKHNQKGSALLWAVAVIMVLSVSIAAGLSIAYSYYNRTVINHSRNQSYVTAKSIVTNIVDSIENGESQYIDLIPENVGGKTSLTIEKLPSSVGKVDQAEIIKSSHEDEVGTKAVVSIAVTFNEQQNIVNAELVQKDGETDWHLVKYFKGEFKKNGNMYYANDVMKKYYDEFNVFLNPLDNDGLNNRLTQDAEEVEIVSKGDDKWGNRVKHDGNINDKIRSYLYHAKFGGSWPLFDNSTTSVADNLGSTKYYIQVYFPKETFSHPVIYASTKNNDYGDWAANLLYNQEDGHWYRLQNIYVSHFKLDTIQVTSFDGKTKEEQEKKLKVIYDKYIKPENIIE